MRARDAMRGEAREFQKLKRNNQKNKIKVVDPARAPPRRAAHRKYRVPTIFQLTMALQRLKISLAFLFLHLWDGDQIPVTKQPKKERYRTPKAHL